MLIDEAATESPTHAGGYAPIISTQRSHRNVGKEKVHRLRLERGFQILYFCFVRTIKLENKIITP